MIKYYLPLKALIPTNNPSELESSVEIVKKMDNLIDTYGLRFFLKLDIQTKLWYLSSKIFDDIFGNKKRIGNIHLYRSQPIDAINAIFDLFKMTHLEDYYWDCLNCKEKNCNQNVHLKTRIIGFDYRVDCRNCKSYHYSELKDGKLYTSTKRPNPERWK